ncbi:MAG: 50S ribosomal protein L18 [Candidatus Levybacteria bacterium]|nr:50S ribosomal protein L18 [Candidatus Levybacteria bacterium]
MKETKIKKIKKDRRAKRVRGKILALKKLPRFTVFRSNRYIYAQVIDDSGRKTLAQANEKELSDVKMSKAQKATEVGKRLAKKAVAKKIKNVVFDKGAYKYHGRIKALAEGAREGGLIF